MRFDFGFFNQDLKEVLASSVAVMIVKATVCLHALALATARCEEEEEEEGVVVAHYTVVLLFFL